LGVFYNDNKATVYYSPGTTGWGAFFAERPAVLWNQPAQVPYKFTTTNGTVTITGCTGPGGAVTIPATINGLPVTSIGAWAFLGCTRLTTITLGNSVTSIGEGAFEGCNSLTGIAIPDSVTSIGDSAFYSCTSLTSVTIPNSVTTIGDYAFYSCWSLTSVIIPSSVTSIGNYAFWYCTNLTSVTIPNNVTSIGGEAFERCTSLPGVYFQGTPPSLGSGVFSGDPASVYYSPGTTGWAATFGGLPTVLWNPQMPTDDASFGVRTNRFGFTITGTTNLVVVVEANTSLQYPKWVPVGTNTLTGGSSYFSDPRWTNIPARFYRLRSP
jgi:hypothetical protein